MANTMVSSGQLEMEGSLTTSIYGCFLNTTATGTQTSLSAFYRGGGNVPNTLQNENIPTSGQIEFSDFYGSTNNSTPTWAVEVTPTSGTLLYAICYGATGGFCAVGGNSSGQGVVYMSSNGTSWVLTTITSVGALNSVATDGSGNYIAMSQVGNGAYSTNSGVTWSKLTATNAPIGSNVVAYGNGDFAAGTSGGAVNFVSATTFHTTPSTTWTAGTAFTGGAAITALAYFNSTWLAGATSGNFHTGTNAFVWTSQSSIGTGAIGGFAFGGTTYLADTTAGIYLTTTGSFPSGFSSATNQPASFIDGTLIYNSTFAGVGADGNIYASTNPASVAWTVSDTYAGASNLVALAFGASVYVAVGSYILTSSSV